MAWDRISGYYRMIVRAVEEGWEVLFHRAHALLAAEIALRWQGEERIERVAETIAAIAQHDDLEREFEEPRRTPAGGPEDFTQRDHSDEKEIPRWEEALEMALYRSRWVALLTARHICFLNVQLRCHSDCLEGFCQKLEARIEGWRRELDIPKEEVESTYAFMQWCDRLSLILAQDELPAGDRWLEISPGPDGVRYDIRRVEAASELEVRPWPFREQAFTVGADVRTLNQLKFPSDASLRKALADAPVTSRLWHFRKPPDG